VTVFESLTGALWLALVLYWVQARSARRSIGGRWTWWREIALRLAFFAFVLLALRLAISGRALPQAPAYAFNTSMLSGIIGLVICALGIGLAILGRAWLARNGDMLVTTGPYAWVRHPIYGGMLLAMLGSALAQSLLWLLPLLVYGPTFISSAHREERRLSEQFPERYRAYMKRTRMLLPFVL
jgi:protein-S-isoprenylcysteine O-methyltransferase Ste14